MKGGDENMNEFAFSIPQNIKVGAGSLSKLPELAKELGRTRQEVYDAYHQLNK